MMVKIFIDPGHGGSDPGAVGNGLQEKNVTLSISKRIRDILISEYENVTIRMSRTGDETVSLTSRTNAANSWGADFYLSVHINSGGGTGFESYVYPRVGRPTKTYQEHIHNKVIEQINLRNRGLKEANFHVLRESHMPAVLTENGFIDNSGDAANLKNVDFIERLARGHVNGIVASFQLSKKVQPRPSQPTNPPANGLFRVQIGAFKDRNNADTVENKAKSNGFQTYVKQEDGLFKIQIGAFTDRGNAEELVKRAKAAGLDATIIFK